MPLKRIVGGETDGRWSSTLAAGCTLKQLTAKVSQTLQNIPPVIFANAVSKLEMAYAEAAKFAEQFAVQASDAPVFADIKAVLDVGLATRREIQIVQHVTIHHKDRATLKSKIMKERVKAKEEGIEMMISASVLGLMAKAEAGRE